jgi:hypothetical protein
VSKTKKKKFYNNDDPRSNSSRGVKSDAGNVDCRSNSSRGRKSDAGSCVTDLERISSMKGITVLRGRVPNMSRTLTDQVSMFKKVFLFVTDSEDNRTAK